ncbi:MAG: LytTR family DNA-binding domain-containing protein [Acidobacteriota bacterium]
MTLRALIVDDEPSARAGLAALLARDPTVEVVGEAASAEGAVEAIRSLRPDLVLLDIQMPQGSGFDVLATLAEDTPHPLVIFVTAHDEFSLQAFEVHALDYLLKPFSDERFWQALARAKEQKRLRQSLDLGERIRRFAEDHQLARAPGGVHQPRRRFALRSRGRIHYVDADEVDWIEAAEDYCRLHTGKRRHLMRQTMSGLEASLDPRRFRRIHRSVIVNLDRAVSLRPGARGSAVLVLQDGTELPVSKQHRRSLVEALEG